VSSLSGIGMVVIMDNPALIGSALAADQALDQRHK
jgi:hypothetical protein